jgi:hypothetical protein
VDEMSGGPGGFDGWSGFKKSENDQTNPILDSTNMVQPRKPQKTITILKTSSLSCLSS